MKQLRLMLFLFVSISAKNVGLANILPPHIPPVEITVYLDYSYLRNDIISYAKEWVGSRYRSGSTNPQHGFDCSGFTSYILSKFNIKVSRSSDLQSREGEMISLDMTRPGDLVFFGRHGNVSHVALVVANNEDGIFIVHSTSSKGVIIENIKESEYWNNKIVTARNVIDEQVFMQANP